MIPVITRQINKSLLQQKHRHTGREVTTLIPSRYAENEKNGKQFCKPLSWKSDLAKEWFMSQMEFISFLLPLLESFFFLTLFFFFFLFICFVLMCYGCMKLSFKIVWRIFRVDVWFGICKYRCYKCYIQTRRMDTLPSTSQTRSILITLQGLSSELIIFPSET